MSARRAKEERLVARRLPWMEILRWPPAVSLNCQPCRRAGTKTPVDFRVTFLTGGPPVFVCRDCVLEAINRMVGVLES